MVSDAASLRGLYVITHHQHSPDQQLYDQAAMAIRGGAKILQYRDKSWGQKKRLAQAEKLRLLTRQKNCIFIINDDISLTKAVQADGVHLGGEDASIETARSELGDQAIIGVSCYNEFDRAVSAQQQGASYAAFGRFYKSSTKPGEIYASLELLKQAKNQLDIPIVAIGGISYENADPLIQAGADMIAVADGVFGQPDIRQAANQLQLLFDKQDS